MSDSSDEAVTAWELTLKRASSADSFPASNLVEVAIEQGMSERVACFVRESGPADTRSEKVGDLLCLFIRASFCGKLARVGETEVEICPYGNLNFDYHRFTPEPLARDLFCAATQWVELHPIG